MTKSEAQKLDEQPTLYGIEEAEAEVYKYATHFRRQLKARLLSDKIVTQIVRETTLSPFDFLKSNGLPKRRVEDAATIAWKLTTGAYYKDGGRPWQLADVRPGVCSVGLTSCLAWCMTKIHMLGAHFSTLPPASAQSLKPPRL